MLSDLMQLYSVSLNFIISFITVKKFREFIKISSELSDGWSKQKTF